MEVQRITNCILIHNGKILMIKKPRRGWHAIPGGKMEQGETVLEGAIREFKEETNLDLKNPKLQGVFSFLTYDDQQRLIHEWMMHTFVATNYEGTLTTHCKEGTLKWIPVEDILTVPMAEGDREIFKHVLTGEDILYGIFSYTRDEKLIRFRKSIL